MTTYRYSKLCVLRWKYSLVAFLYPFENSGLIVVVIDELAYSGKSRRVFGRSANSIPVCGRLSECHVNVLRSQPGILLLYSRVCVGGECTWVLRVYGCERDKNTSEKKVVNQKAKCIKHFATGGNAKRNSKIPQDVDSCQAHTNTKLLMISLFVYLEVVLLCIQIKKHPNLRRGNNRLRTNICLMETKCELRVKCIYMFVLWINWIWMCCACVDERE